MNLPVISQRKGSLTFIAIIFLSIIGENTPASTSGG